jgi:hypothetical protein
MTRRLLVLAAVLVAVVGATYAVSASIALATVAAVAVGICWLLWRARETDRRSRYTQAQMDAGVIAASAVWWHAGPHDSPSSPSDFGGSIGGGDVGV